MIVAVDFDQTLCDTHLTLGPEVPGAFDWCKKLQGVGVKLILWTNRASLLLVEALWYCKQRQLEFWSVNRSGWWWQRLLYHSPKVYADYFVDDRNLGCPLIYRDGLWPIVDWSIVGPMLWGLSN